MQKVKRGDVFVSLIDQVTDSGHHSTTAGQMVEMEDGRRNIRDNTIYFISDCLGTFHWKGCWRKASEAETRAFRSGATHASSSIKSSSSRRYVKILKDNARCISVAKVGDYLENNGLNELWYFTDKRNLIGWDVNVNDKEEFQLMPEGWTLESESKINPEKRWHIAVTKENKKVLGKWRDAGPYGVFTYDNPYGYCWDKRYDYEKGYWGENIPDHVSEEVTTQWFLNNIYPEGKGHYVQSDYGKHVLLSDDMPKPLPATDFKPSIDQSFDEPVIMTSKKKKTKLLIV